MNDTIIRAIAPPGARGGLGAAANIADAPLQEREAMIDRVCEAILSKSGSLRAGNLS